MFTVLDIPKRTRHRYRWAHALGECDVVNVIHANGVVNKTTSTLLHVELERLPQHRENAENMENS